MVAMPDRFSSQPPNRPALAHKPALLLAGGLGLFQLASIGLLYKHGVEFECLANWPAAACAGASGILVSLYAALAALALYFMLAPQALRDLLGEAGHSWAPLLLNLTGFALALRPALILFPGQGTAMLVPVFTLWIIGFSGVLLGLMWFVAPAARWMRLLRGHGGRLLPVLLAGLLAPPLATLIRPLWQIDKVADVTFDAVAGLVQLLGYQVQADAAHKIIGADGFFINVAPVCSGIEGIALVTVFVSLYLILFRSELKFPLAFLLYPVGIALSAGLNVVRITALLALGLEGFPELAVGGFHSHAGWLMFTLVALGLILVARRVPILQRRAAAPRPAAPFLRDPHVAEILPFAIFMFSALLAQAFSNVPGVVYPLRLLAMAGVLWLFVPIYRRFDWRLDPLALAVGALIGLVWVAVPAQAGAAAPAFAGLSGLWLVLWMVARGLGTVLAVPLIEELFFRKYLQGKLTAWAGPVVGIGISAAGFAILHDRWILAFFAGLALSFVMHRRRNVTAAVQAHGLANLIVFVVAVLSGNLNII